MHFEDTEFIHLSFNSFSILLKNNLISSFFCRVKFHCQESCKWDFPFPANENGLISDRQVWKFFQEYFMKRRIDFCSNMPDRKGQKHYSRHTIATQYNIYKHTGTINIILQTRRTQNYFRTAMVNLKLYLFR